MKDQSVFMMERAETDGITIIEAVEKYGQYFRDIYTKRFENIEMCDNERKNLRALD